MPQGTFPIQCFGGLNPSGAGNCGGLGLENALQIWIHTIDLDW